MELKETVNVQSAQYWEMRAEEALSRAGQMRDRDAFTLMLSIAQRYELMAQRIAARQKAVTPASPGVRPS
jgi:hypothetical protein